VAASAVRVKKIQPRISHYFREHNGLISLDLCSCLWLWRCGLCEASSSRFHPNALKALSPLFKILSSNMHQKRQKYSIVITNLWNFFKSSLSSSPNKTKVFSHFIEV
jgi:hypothetical protein